MANQKIIKSNKNPVQIIFERFNNLEGATYVQLFAADDRKKEKKIYSSFLNTKEVDYNKLCQESESHNFATFGVFMNFNPLSEKRRTKENVREIQNIFIDLDHANEKDNELIKTFLKKNDVSYFYNARSGNGFHFLIPINLDKEKEYKVKGFLTYLHNNICDKVDIATFTNERLIRFPGSLHNKFDESRELKTLELFEVDNNIIENNNNLINNFQLEQNKGEKDVHYLSSIKQKDVFFSELLNNQNQWSDYKNLLNCAQERNNIFLKNLGIFIINNEEYKSLCNNFINFWEPARLAHLIGWIKQTGDNKISSVNYYELLKWANKYDLDKFKDILAKQLENNLFDIYEIYFLEDEKVESKYLLYYPDKNYYIQTSEQELLNTIYFDCQERGFDLGEHFNLEELIEDYNHKPFKNKLKIQKDQIFRVLHEEKRIKMVFNINYMPQDVKFFNLNGKRYFNIYNKSALLDYYKKEESYHFPHIKELLENLTGHDVKGLDYLCKWMAAILQNSLQKLPTAIILQGAQGSGKGTFKSFILDQIFGSNNVQEINQTNLESSFNEYLMGKQIIVANEVMHNDNRQTLPNVLKNLVTDPEITISRKFKKEVVGKNYTHWVFCTNSDNPIKIDEDDRRYTVFYSKKLKGGGRAAAKFVKDLRENLEYEIKQFISYLKSFTVEFEDVHEPYMTEAKEDIIELNRDSVNRFIEYLKQFENLLDVQIELFGNDKLKIYHTDNGSFILPDEFYKLYHKWCKDTG